MDGQGRWRDNIFIERLWKTVKYEEMYIKAYESITDAKKELKKFFNQKNVWRRHQGLDDRTPDEVYWSTLPKMKDAV
ncbi:MAG: integrase core domain-containing protein [Proteobacteria bacterium]|nr:integrase core domain-containing protein [Pseudomonadota bacterium]